MLALAPDAPEASFDAPFVISALLVIVDFGAKKTACDGVCGVAGHLYGPPVLHGHEHRAGIRAIVGTSSAYNAQRAFAIDGKRHKPMTAATQRAASE
jgi:hypothetical protein